MHVSPSIGGGGAKERGTSGGKRALPLRHRAEFGSAILRGVAAELKVVVYLCVKQLATVNCIFGTAYALELVKARGEIGRSELGQCIGQFQFVGDIIMLFGEIGYPIPMIRSGEIGIGRGGRQGNFVGVAVNLGLAGG